MIGKVTRGSRVGSLLRYLFGPGRSNEHTDPHLVASFDGSPEQIQPSIGPRGTHDLRRLANVLEEPLYLAQARDWLVDRPVWHASLRIAPEDPELTDSQWAKVAADVVGAVGLGPGATGVGSHSGDPNDSGEGQPGSAQSRDSQRGDRLESQPGCRWVAVRHGPDHIHLVVTLAREDGSSPGLFRDYFKLGAACRKAETELGLRRTAVRNRSAAVVASRAEVEKATRTGREIAPRVRLRTIVQTAVAASASEQEFFTRLLITPGIVLRQRYSTINPGEVTGYSVGVPGDANESGHQITFGGAKLAPDLSLPRLRARWAVPQDSPPPSPPSTSYTPPASAEERRRVLAKATAATKAAAQEITRLAKTNPTASTPLGYAAADLARAAAAVLEERDKPGPLIQAAEDISRASREAWSRIPTPTDTSRALRDTGRALLLLRRLPKGRGREAAALLAQLGALADAITQLRAAQDRLAHAQAATQATVAYLASSTQPEMVGAGAAAGRGGATAPTTQNPPRPVPLIHPGPPLSRPGHPPTPTQPYRPRPPGPTPGRGR